MIKTSVFIATSIDGFIARKDGSMDWLDEANTQVPEGEDCGYSQFMESVDALVMGRKTYEKVLSFENWPYTGKKVIVLSKNEVLFPEKTGKLNERFEGTPSEIIELSKNRGFTHLYIDGGYTIQQFLKYGFISEITITLIPVLLGSGIPLFKDLKNEVKMELIQCTSYDFGFTQLKYKII